MNIWAIICLLFAAIFGIITIIFVLLKERGVMLISGFNTLPKEEREKYDKAKMYIDMRNSLFLWFEVLLLGAFLAHFLNGYCGMAALIVWIILFFKEVHIDSEKAFGKYRK